MDSKREFQVLVLSRFRTAEVAAPFAENAPDRILSFCCMAALRANAVIGARKVRGGRPGV
jgi:hypothetical protein